MSVKEDSLSINHFLNKFIDTRSSEDQRLSLNVSLTYVKALRTNVINKYDKQERVNSVVVLAKLVRYLPKSNSVVELFDEVFFKELLKIGIQKPSDLTGDSVFKIINSALNGSFVEFKTKLTFSGILMAIYNNLKFMDVVPARLAHAQNKNSGSAESLFLTFEFLTYIVHRTSDYYRFDVSIAILGTLRVQDYCSDLSNWVNSADHASGDVSRFISLVGKGIALIFRRMNQTKIDLDNPNHRKIIDQIVKHTKKTYQQSVSSTYGGTTGTVSEADIFEQSGITSNPVQFLAENFTLSEVYNSRIFLLGHSEEFRKKYYEQLILTRVKSRFPLIKMCLAVSHYQSGELFAAITLPDAPKGTKNYYHNIQNYYIYYDVIFSALMLKTLEFWDKSKAENQYVVGQSDSDQQDDVMVIINLLKALMKYVNTLIDEKKDSLDRIKNLIRSVTFEKTREEQMKQIFQERQAFWGKDIDAFDNILELEVANFVKEERILQLMKGFWFYAEDPRASESKIQHFFNNNNPTGTAQNIPTTRHKRIKKYYVCLAPNRQSILYKDFVTKAAVAPILEKSNSKTIILSAIKDVNVIPLNGANTNGVSGSNSSANSSKFPSSRHINLFINIKSRNSFHQIQMLDRSSKEIVSFYTDTHDLACIWADGVKLLLNKPISSTTEFTKLQIEKLFDVRRAVQFSSIIDSSLTAAHTSAFGSEPGTETNQELTITNGVLTSLARRPSKLSRTVTLNEEEDESLYDYDELIKATEGYYYD